MLQLLGGLLLVLINVVHSSSDEGQIYAVLISAAVGEKLVGMVCEF